MIVNFVISSDLKSRIFCDIFQRFIDRNEDGREIVVSERPVEGADVYHYHRVHLEDEIRHPAAVTVHHDPADVDGWLKPERFRRHYRDAEMVVCLNSLQREALERSGVPNRCVIPHGYDARLFAKKPLRRFEPGRRLVLGIVSRRYERRVKGEVWLYELMQRLDPERFAFLMVGEGRVQDALFARDLGFEAEVFEFMPYRLFPAVYGRMDFLLMPSHAEGGPANIPEAVASGTPALCTPVGMAVDLVRDGENGLLLSGRIERDIALFDRLARNEGGLTDALYRGAHDLTTRSPGTRSSTATSICTERWRRAGADRPPGQRDGTPNEDRSP